ncbi:MAG TPA: putative sulfate exporter family transporter [Nonomuraea sp.]|nr:putative sulfate exporter family transporter [Nonomuraea sp.]
MSAEATEGRTTTGLDVAGGVLAVLVLGAATRFLEQSVPAATEGGPFEQLGAAIEYPVYAIALGLIGNAVLTGTGLRERLSGGFRTEFFIKTGLVLLGASINLKVIATAAGPAIAQAVVLISCVFLFTWWLGGRLGLDDKLRALLASAVSICIVKVTQNALMGVVAVVLTAYFAFKVERRPDAPRPRLVDLWHRFPKFVLGFVAASVIATWYLGVGGDKAAIGVVNDLRVWFLILAFVSIGLEFRVSSLREAGWRPVGVFAAATAVNLLLALGLAALLFGGFAV